MADNPTPDMVTLRNRDTGEELVRPKRAAKFYPDYDVLTAAGRVNTKATAAAAAPTEKE